MRSEWEFQFSTHGFRFNREYRYKIKIEDKISIGQREPESIEPTVRIVPSDQEPFPDADQIGSMHILLPYSPEESRELSFFCATTFAERISFTHGDFRIFGGLIFCKRIPETAEEVVEVRDSPYAVEMSLAEETPPNDFNPEALQESPNLANRLPLIAQFNEARRIQQHIAKFVSFFKIIESLTHTKSESRYLKAVLVESRELRRIYHGLNASIDFDSFIERAVSARHNCAHLKMNKEFGYTPLDSAVKNEVAPLLPILEALAYMCITGWQEAGAS